jgi:hypothetical protein
MQPRSPFAWLKLSSRNDRPNGGWRDSQAMLESNLWEVLAAGRKIGRKASKLSPRRRLAPRPVRDIFPVRLRGSLGSRIEEHTQPLFFSS